MDRYWSHSKVYFFAQLVLTPGHLSYRPFTLKEIDKNVYAQSSQALVQTIRNYAKVGLFKVAITFDPSYIEHEIRVAKGAMVAPASGSQAYKPRENFGLDPVYEKVKKNLPLADEDLDYLIKNLPQKISSYLHFKISDIKQEECRAELTSYLDKYKQDDLTTGGTEDPESYQVQFVRMYNTLAKLYPTYRYKPVVKLTDIWSNQFKRSFIQARFWELILSSHFAQTIKILNFGYGGSYKNSSRLESQTYTYNYELPFAKIEVLEPLKQYIPYRPQASTQAIQESTNAAHPVDASQHPLVLTVDIEKRHLVFHLGNHSKLISKRQFKYQGDPLKLLRQMVRNKGREVTRANVGLPPNQKISNMVQDAGFTSLLHAKLLEGSSADAVILKTEAYITEEEHRAILKSCQEKFDLIRLDAEKKTS